MSYYFTEITNHNILSYGGYPAAATGTAGLQQYMKEFDYKIETYYCRYCPIYPVRGIYNCVYALQHGPLQVGKMLIGFATLKKRASVFV